MWQRIGELLSEQDFSSILQAFSLAIAAISLLLYVMEYSHQNRLKRFDKFQTIRLKLKQNETFLRICELLESDDPELTNLDYLSKHEFLGLYEEIALALNSKIINENVAHYMFGYYVIRCWDSDKFWSGINRDSYYWSLFRHFALTMKAVENKVIVGKRQASSQFRF